MNRTIRLLALLPAALATLAALPARANDVASCRNMGSSYSQSILSPANNSGDEEFFSKPPGPPNIMFLLGNNKTMQDFPVPLPHNGGTDYKCDDAAWTTSYFNVATDGANKADPYLDHTFEPGKYYIVYSDQPPIDGTNPNGYGMDNDFSKKDQFYKFDMTGGGGICGPSSGSDGKFADFIQADGVSLTWSTTKYNDCTNCLTTKGWFRGPAAANGHGYYWAVSGRFLNKYPPKFVIARKVIHDVFLAAGAVRLGISVLTTDDALFDPAGYLFNGGGSRLTPACDKALKGQGFNEDRPALTNALYNTQFDQDGHGVGEALFSIGGYYSYESDWEGWFSSVAKVTSTATFGNTPDNNNYPNTVSGGWSNGGSTWIQGTGNYTQVYESGGAQHMAMCFPCQVSSVIIISDATPSADNSVPVTKMMSLAATATGDSTLNINPGAFPPGGVNYCTHWCPSGAGNVGAASSACVDLCDQGSSPQGPDRGNRNFMDDVAFFLSHVDLRSDMTGKQVVNTYTIGFGAGDDPMLHGMAEAGGGTFTNSSDESTLEAAIFQAIAHIKARATSASSASINNVQAGGAQTAFVPRFQPADGQAFWPGDLEAYTLYFEQGATCVANGTGDLDQNGKCDGVYLVDKNNKRVAADVAGTINPSLPGLYYEMQPGGVNLSTTRAAPFWSAAVKLGARDPGTRQVWTAVDTNNDGDIDNTDDPVRFTPDNWSQLLPYLNITSDPNFCQQFGARAGISAIGQDTTFEACARYLIKFVLGYDVLNRESANNSDGGYPWANNTRGSRTASWAGNSEVLGDIFHSSPIKIISPVNESVCTGPDQFQCVPTLFGTSTPKDVTGGKDAYQQWQEAVVGRSQPDVLAVGANDGMLHIFKASCWVTGDNPKTAALESRYQSSDPALCPAGQALPGDELFAFIPPDLLPKLKNLVGITHQYFVDGTPEVKDIWVDGVGNDDLVSTGDNIKQASEYRTIMVVGERRGGTHYFALDMSDPTAFDEGRADTPMKTSGTSGNRFRYIYPKLSSLENLTFGETWNDFEPNPPTIGPVRYKVSGAPANSYTPLGGGSPQYYKEKYVALVGGGYDPLQVRGRGIYMFDVWSGQTLWKMDASTNAAMDYSVAAMPAMTNWGNTSDQLRVPDNSEFFDTAVVGDTGGQVWTVRFYDPDPSKWSAARAFQEAAEEGNDDTHRYPIFNIAALGKLPNSGLLRASFGTGDRQHLRDQDVGNCTMGNLQACARIGCNVSVTAAYSTGLDVLADVYTYTGGTRGSETVTLPAGGGGCGVLNLAATTVSVTHCPGGQDTTDVPYGQLTCPVGGSGTLSNIFNLLVDGGVPACIENAGDQADLKNNYSPPNLDTTLNSNSMGLRNRFMSMLVFDNSGRQPFNDATGATSYDGVRLEERGTTSARILKELSVSSPTYTTETDRGWVYTYPVYDERGSNNPVSAGGCMFWSTVQGGTYCATNADCCDPFPDGGPNSGCGATCGSNNECTGGRNPCNSIGNSSQFSYSADIITGRPGCGLAFDGGSGTGLRRIACTQNCDVLPAPPPEPVSFIDANGQLRTMLIGVSGQGVNAQQVTQPDDLVKSLYDVVLPQNTHDCRHGAGGAACQ